MDGTTSLTRREFISMLVKTVPALTPVPWDAVHEAGFVHLGLFVHRVRDLPSGIYLLVRDPRKKELLLNCMRAGFAWSRVDGTPEGLHLFLLEERDCRALAEGIGCGQEIAASGAFSVAMLAEFEPIIREKGAHWYRRLHWEAGLIGQVLYLEAEAAGVRATGMGCFFDDSTHDVFGLKDRTLQCLYHFTVGGPVDDPRLTTLPAYPPPAHGSL